MASDGEIRRRPSCTQSVQAGRCGLLDANIPKHIHIVLHIIANPIIHVVLLIIANSQRSGKHYCQSLSDASDSSSELGSYCRPEHAYTRTE